MGFDLGSDSADFIRGAMDARVVLTVADGDSGILNANLDLTDGELDIPALNWSKKAGTAATARVDVKLQGDRVEEITSFELKADDILIRVPPAPPPTAWKGSTWTESSTAGRT